MGITETIKQRWDGLWQRQLINYIPEQNSETVFRDGKLPLKLGYVPERAKRFNSRNERQNPLGENLPEREDCLECFDTLVLLANNRPISRYHSILCTIQYVAQNDFEYRHIREVTQIVENTGIRSFLNLTGTAATLNHFHTQVIFENLNVESLWPEFRRGRLGFLPDYPGGNLLITGDLNERCDWLFEKIGQLSRADLPSTLKNDGSSSKAPLYNLLFWNNQILLVPRRRETPLTIKAMAGGLELSGYFLITEPGAPDDIFAGFHYGRLLEALQEVTFNSQDVKFLLDS